MVLLIALQSVTANEEDTGQYGSVRVPHRYGKRNFLIFAPPAFTIFDLVNTVKENRNEEFSLYDNEDVIRKKVYLY